MLTDKQVSELETLIRNNKEHNQSLRISDVTKVLYPVDKNTRQHKLKSTN